MYCEGNRRDLQKLMAFKTTDAFPKQTDVLIDDCAQLALDDVEKACEDLLQRPPSNSNHFGSVAGDLQATSNSRVLTISFGPGVSSQSLI